MQRDAGIGQASQRDQQIKIAQALLILKLGCVQNQWLILEFRPPTFAPDGRCDPLMMQASRHGPRLRQTQISAVKVPLPWLKLL